MTLLGELLKSMPILSGPGADQFHGFIRQRAIRDFEQHASLLLTHRVRELRCQRLKVVLKYNHRVMTELIALANAWALLLPEQYMLNFFEGYMPGQGAVVQVKVQEEKSGR